MWGNGLGNDTVHDIEPKRFYAGTDRVLFGPGVTPEDLHVRWSGDDLLIHLNYGLPSQETLTILQQGSINALGAYYEIKAFEFQDGANGEVDTVLTAADLRAKAILDNQTTGN